MNLFYTLEFTKIIPFTRFSWGIKIERGTILILSLDRLSRSIKQPFEGSISSEHISGVSDSNEEI